MHPQPGRAVWPRPEPSVGRPPGRGPAGAALARMVWGLWLLLAWSAPSAGFAAAVELSPPEARYVAERGVVTLCVDPDWPPFETIDAAGRHVGIAADLLGLVAERTGLRFALVPTASWDESLEAARQGRCRALSFLNRTPQREQWLSFTRPLLSDVNVFITREEHAFIADPGRLDGESIVFPSGTAMEELIRRDYPNLNLLTTDSEEEAIAMVSDRQADMTMRSLIVAAYTIKKEGLFNLKIAGQIPEYTNQLRIGVLKEEKVLRDILDKGVSTITPQEREAISNKHVSITVQSRVNYVLVFQVAGVAGLLILVTILWNRKLAQYNRKLEQLNLELERLSVTDKLTGLFNRVKLDAVLAKEINRASRFGETFSVLILDIDHFKEINDQHGHHAGDRVLEQIARTLMQNTRKIDTVGRWGGEEFLIVCPNTDANGARQLAENLRNAIAQLEFPGIGKKTVSIGASSFQLDDQVEDIASRADHALYEAKNAGRNRVEVR